MKKKNIGSFKEKSDFYEYLLLKPEASCLHCVFNLEELQRCKKHSFFNALINIVKCEAVKCILVLGQPCKAFFSKTNEEYITLICVSLCPVISIWQFYLYCYSKKYKIITITLKRILWLLAA